MIRRKPPSHTVDTEAHLKWLIALTTLDLKELAKGRPGDLPNVVYDLEKWLGVYDDPKLAGQIRKLLRQPRLLQPLINETSALVASVADRRKFSYRYSDGEVEIDAGRLERGDARAVSYRFSDLLDAVVQVAIHDLTRYDALKVRRCGEQTCHKIFLASRRSQIYCSHRCANVRASRKYRTTHRRKRAERERQRYRSKVRERIGSGSVRVGREPRLPKK